jgi:hypothetical protein
MSSSEVDAGFASGLKRVLTRRLPAWVTFAAVIAVTAVLGGMLVMQQLGALRLDPAVGAAEQIEMRIELCNAEVDRLDINPRESERDLEETFTDEGAAEARVRVDRRDCPPGAGGE